MAGYAGGAQTDQTTLGFPSSFEMTGALISPNVLAPYTVGSGAGVPPNDAVSGGVSGAQEAADYGLRKAGQPAHRQPILWSVALLVIGVFILGHIAHLETRG